MRGVKISVALLILLLAGSIVLSKSLFVVDEMHYAVVTQFGLPKKVVKDAGLGFKLPFVQNANYLPKRILEWKGKPTDLVTKDKKYIFADTWARWRIADPLLFYQRLNTEAGGQGMLDDQIESATRDVIARYDLIEVVRTSNRELVYTDPELKEALGTQEQIKVGRVELGREILEAASRHAGDFGIELTDVQINRVVYVKEVQQSVYDRMSAERDRIAQRYRSEGKEEASRIQGEMEWELYRISSEGYSESKRIRGEGDAEALQIYADAYSKAPEFYRFWRTLQTYEKAVDRNTSLILSADNEYFRLLVNPTLEAGEEAAD